MDYLIRELNKDTDFPGSILAYFEGFFYTELTDEIKVFLRDMLEIFFDVADFTLVAEVDGEVRGYIMGQFAEEFLLSEKDENKDSIWWKMFKIGLKYGFNTYKLPKGFRKEMKGIYRRVMNLRGHGEITADVEVINLCAQRGYRHGIGKALMDAFLLRVKAKDCKKVKVVSETVVNYQFYENYGFQKVLEEDMKIPQLLNKTLVYTLKIDA